MARHQSIDARLLQKVSRYYYEEDLNQIEISKRLNLSRSKVSRLLQQAKDLGLIKISVLPQPGFHTALENALERKFGLAEAVVVEVSDPESQQAVSKEVGMAAAETFIRVVENGAIVGISWGTSLRAMVDSLPVMDLHDSQVVQLIGGLGSPESDAHVSYILRRLIRQTNSKAAILNMPGIVDSVMIKEALMSDSMVQNTFQLYDQVDIAFVGIGVPTSDSVVMRDGTILSQDELKAIKQKGAVGDVCLRFFDQQGKLVDSDINKRVIGIPLDDLRKIPKVVGIAGGPEKHEVIRAALNTGIIKILITDHITAEELIKE